jgi:CheY-like chemotaxis protein
MPEVPRPDLILLDLNLPGKSGWEVLQEIKQHDDFRQIPVVILTSSRSPDDVANAYRAHANSYLCKPVRLAEVFELVSELQRYWFRVASIPSRITPA